MPRAVFEDSSSSFEFEWRNFKLKMKLRMARDFPQEIRVLLLDKSVLYILR